MSIETVPTELRGLRACLLCSLIKTLQQFVEDGCDNCEDVLGLKHDADKVHECTSANFDGMIALCDQEESWVARWQKIDNKCKGVYAVSVSGSLPKEVADDLNSMKIYYRSGMRDKSQK